MSEVYPAYYDHTQEGLEELFADLDSQYFIHKHVIIDDNNQVDINATAQSLNATVAHEDIGSRYSLLTVVDHRYKILLSPDLDEDDKQFVFGHEIGHIALFAHYLDLGIVSEQLFKRTANELEFYRYIEAFCDYFAGRMLDSVYSHTLPRRKRPPATNSDADQLSLLI